MKMKDREPQSCWKDLRMATVASMMFTGVTSWTQLMAMIAYWWTGGGSLTDIAATLSLLPPAPSEGVTTSNDSYWAFINPVKQIVMTHQEKIILGSAATMTIIDTLMILIASIALIGLIKPIKGRWHVMLWVRFLIVYVAFEFVFNVLVLFHLGNSYYYYDIFSTPAILIFVYWIVKLFLNVCGIRIGFGFSRQLKLAVRLASVTSYPTLPTSFINPHALGLGPTPPTTPLPPAYSASGPPSSYFAVKPLPTGRISTDESASSRRCSVDNSSPIQAPPTASFSIKPIRSRRLSIDITAANSNHASVDTGLNQPPFQIPE